MALARCLASSSMKVAHAFASPSATSTLRGTGIAVPRMGARAFRSRGLQFVNAAAVGDKLPEATFNFFDAEKQMQEITTDELCKGKKVILFAVPGAFTPTCSSKHLPGFLDMAGQLKAKGVDSIGCISVNDAFVMDAWGQSLNVGDKILMLADGSASFAKALGVELDLTDKGLGVRSRRYAMLVEDGEIKVLNLEEGGAFTVSSAEEMLHALS
ncbi:hypothetical protein BSKO_11315 [Bryopsis sp. KO-2023]|nr:hypothetical protein BSKO_11315 [Bryopsis sp. KO-2023]